MKNKRNYIIVNKNNTKYDFQNSKHDYKKYIIIPDNISYDRNCYYENYENLEDAQKRCKILNNQYNISCYSNDEIETFYNNIDWNKLIEIIKNKLNLSDINFNIKLKSRVNLFTKLNIYNVEFKLNHDFCKENKLLNNIFKSCYLKLEHNGFDVNPKTGELYFYLNLYFDYSYFNNRHVYSDFLSAKYFQSTNEVNKWVINFIDKRDKRNL